MDHWTKTGVEGLEARDGGDGLVYVRAGGQVHQADLGRLRQMAAPGGPGGSGAEAWTPDLARIVLRALRLADTE
ncbi:hypothetical protein ACFVJM_38165 [Streptomyces virginiae]|uniref:hypothetical protein n=1 Tax=Streptomyces virginiae TaxID=1961 RepID=UPI00362FD380